jgi:predicted Zn-dependent protease
MKLPIKKPVLLLSGLALVGVLSACSSFLNDTGVATRQTGVGGNATQMAVPAGTRPGDDVVGRREHPRIVASYGGVYSKRSAEVLVARIAGRLLAATNQGNANYTVTILDTPDVNAFALPGGYIYVTRGILALANDSSELAAVLAHEIAHVTLRHARARSSRTRTSQIVDQVISGVFGGNPNTDQTAARAKLSLAAFSQGQELAADKEGVQTAGKAGYDPHAAARFLASMGRFAEASTGAQANSADFLSSHPSTPDRIQKAIESARAFGAPGIGETGRAEYLKAIDGLRFGDSPNQGVIVGRRFIHPTLKFTFEAPKGYTLQNSQNAVVAVAGAGNAVRFDSAEVPTTTSLEAYLQSGWIAGLKPETIRSRRENNIDIVYGDAVSDDWFFKVAVLRFKGKVYRFIFAGREETQAFLKSVDRVLTSFRATNGDDLRKVRKSSIRLVKAKAGDTTETLARKMRGLKNGRALFMMLNDLYQGDRLVPGQNYKIVIAK